MAKKKSRATAAHLNVAPAQAPVPPPVKASLIFTNVIAVIRRGLFTGDDARVAAEAIMFLEQVAQGEKSAEDQRESAAAEEAKSDG